MKSRLAVLAHRGRACAALEAVYCGSRSRLRCSCWSYRRDQPAPSRTVASARSPRADSRFSRAKMKLLRSATATSSPARPEVRAPTRGPRSGSSARAKLQSSIAKRPAAVSTRPAGVTEDSGFARVDQLGHRQCVRTSKRILHQQHRSLSPHLGLPSASATPRSIKRSLPSSTGGFDPSSGQPDSACQVGLGGKRARFFQAKGKILGKCEDLVLKGSITVPCPDERAELAIDARAKGDPRRCARACGGPDRVCGTDDDPRHRQHRLHR